MARILLTAAVAFAGLFISGSAPAQTPPAATPGQGAIKACGETVSVYYHPIAADVPANVRAFMGQWGNGSQGWDVNLCHVLAVTWVDKAGDASAVYIYGAYPKWGMDTPGEEILAGKINGDVLSVTTTTGTPVTYTLAKNALSGQYLLGNDTYSITLAKAH